MPFASNWAIVFHFQSSFLLWLRCREEYVSMMSNKTCWRATETHCNPLQYYFFVFIFLAFFGGNDEILMYYEAANIHISNANLPGHFIWPSCLVHVDPSLLDHASCSRTRVVLFLAGLVRRFVSIMWVWKWAKAKKDRGHLAVWHHHQAHNRSFWNLHFPHSAGVFGIKVSFNAHP